GARALRLAARYWRAIRLTWCAPLRNRVGSARRRETLRRHLPGLPLPTGTGRGCSEPRRSSVSPPWHCGRTSPRPAVSFGETRRLLDGTEPQPTPVPVLSPYSKSALPL